jgi:phenylpropionate dioxygenase-like ring-hydroxylating dioxygenase large terminal subunit
MIRNRWYAALDAAEVPTGKLVGVRRFGEDLALFRDGEGRVVCLADRCVHRGAALSAGRVRDGHVECPFHGFRYDARGRCRLIPAAGRSAEVPERFRVRAYSALEAHGFVWIFWGDEGADPASREETKTPAFFNDLDGFASSTFTSAWPVHYSRAVENQLDVMHLPFVHATTIGRGGKTLVEGPIVEWLTPDHLRYWVFNRDDEGQAPRPIEELSKSESPVHLDLILPNVWQNHIAPKLRVVAAFAPVDEANTLIYLRLYQKLFTVPGLHHLISAPVQLLNRVILNQDRRVVVTQRPLASSLRMGEQLVAGDRPIAFYRRRRQELIDEAGSQSS